MAQYADWAAVQGNDPAVANAEEAFLLGVNLADYGDGLKATTVSFAADGTLAIDTNADLTKVKGRLFVKWALTPDAAADGWTKVTVSPDTEDASLITGVTAGGGAKFFKVGVDYALPPQE